MNEDVLKSLKTVGNATNQLSEKRHALLQHILLVSATLFGILISLHNSSSHPPLTRYCFAVSICLLGLGIFLTGVALYGHIDTVDRARKAFVDESKIAFLEHRSPEPVGVPPGKQFVFAEKLSYVMLSFSVIFLCAYSVLIAVW